MHHSDSTPAGFALYQRGLGGYSRSPELLVPIHLKPLLQLEEKLKEEELQKLQRQEELEMDRSNAATPSQQRVESSSARNVG